MCDCTGKCFGACGEKLSPAEINMRNSKDARKQEKETQGRANHPAEGIKEHTSLVSRTNGKTYEVSLGPVGGGLVPANPFASLAQEGWAHSHPDKFGRKNLAEFDAATKGKHLPARVK